MLVRALKVLGYFLFVTTGTDIDTAALDQPGDEVALMAEPSRIGNDEPRSRFPHKLPCAVGGATSKQEKKTISAQSIGRFADFGRMRASRSMFVAAALAEVLGPAGRWQATRG